MKEIIFTEKLGIKCWERRDLVEGYNRGLKVGDVRRIPAESVFLRVHWSQD